MQPPTARACTMAVAAFYAALFILSSSGRLASADAGAELQASTLLATTGRWTADAPPATGAAGWVRGADGRYHEPHDIAPLLFLAPAAWLGHATSSRTAAEDFDSPPVVSRVLGSLSYALLSAAACTLLFAVFARDVASTRRAFLLSTLLPVTTFFWPYAKTAWDVVGAACGMCAVLYFARRALDSPTVRSGLGLGAALVVTASFRYSLLPFLAVALAVLASADRRSGRQWVAAAGTLLIGLLPTFAYNAARTGSLLRPANASAAYLEGNNALTGNVLHGFWSLLASPNRGLLLFAPTTILLLAMPAVWPRLGREQRLVAAATGAGAVLYLLFVSTLRNWGGSFGWGPRFLLPIVPSAMYAVGLAVDRLWAEHRLRLAALITAAAVWQAPAVLVNWSLAIVVLPAALDQDALWPYQHAAVWGTLVSGATGTPLAAPPEVASDPERSAGTRFPDLWLCRLAERSGAGRAAAAVLALGLVLALLGTLRLLLT